MFIYIGSILKSPRKRAHIIKIWVILFILRGLICNTMLQSKLLIIFELLQIAPRGVGQLLAYFLVGVALSIACFCYLYGVIIFANSHLSNFSIVVLSLLKSIFIFLISHVWSWVVDCSAWEAAEPPSWLFLGFISWMQEFIFIFLLNHF
jgi:hypothetical protein